MLSTSSLKEKVIPHSVVTERGKKKTQQIHLPFMLRGQNYTGPAQHIFDLTIFQPPEEKENAGNSISSVIFPPFFWYSHSL